MTGAAPNDRPAISDQTEAALVEAARQHDQTAVRELVRRLNARLFHIARGLMPSDAEAEEVVQDAYLAAFAHLDDFRGSARFSTWIIRITLNCAGMRLRRKRPETEYDTVNETMGQTAGRDGAVLHFPGSNPEAAEAALGRQQTRAIIEAAVAELPTDLRVIFLMHEASGMTLADIARDLSMPLGTAKTRLMRARHQLRRIIAARIQGGFDTIFPFAGRRCAAMADRVVARLATTPPRESPRDHTAED